MEKKTLIVKWLALEIVLLFIGTCIIPAIAQDTKKPTSALGGTWLYVGGNGVGNYTKIQDAIDDAKVGDTIFVYDDSSPYNETIIISKSLSLIGETKETTIINGHHEQYDDTLINIDESPNVTISEFTLHHKAGLLIAIRAEDSPGLILSNNILDDTTDIGFLIINCEKTRVFDNILENTSIYGINLFLSDASIISRNTLRSYGEYGLYIDESNACLIEDNSIMYALSYGLYMQNCEKNTIIHNSFINNSNQSLLITLSAGNKITENNFIGNHDSVFFIQAFFNHWSSNYWGRSHLIKFIRGIHLVYDTGPIPYPIIKLDRHPAQEPFFL